MFAVVLMLLGAAQFGLFLFIGDNNPESLFKSTGVFVTTLVIGIGYLKIAKSFNPE